jgi:FMN-dependent NADH-azoreductase
MTNILVLESSLFPPNVSASRQVTDRFVQGWREREPDVLTVRRDLAIQPLPHVGLDLMAGSVTPADARTSAQAEAVAISDTVIDELFAADVLVIGAPMYNFSIPSSLKAWVDHVSIAGRTFRYTPEGRPEGLVTGKRVFVIVSRGGVYGAEPMAAFNFQDTYLRSVLGFLGLADVTVIAAERQKMGPVEQEAGLAQAYNQVAEVLDTAVCPAA